jgi:GNAT superfamily N-acetyltransferase
LQSDAYCLKRSHLYSGLEMTIWKNQNFTITNDKTDLQTDVIHKFLREESYWAKDRSFEKTKIAIENSLCFGMYFEGKQIGFARVVSDFATFAYLGDVFILEEFRGKGLSKWLMEVIISHEDLQDLRRWVLATKDAHGLYAQFEFSGLKFPDRWMEKTAPNAY